MATLVDCRDTKSTEEPKKPKSTKSAEEPKKPKEGDAAICANACTVKKDCIKVGAWFKCGHTMCVKAALHCGFCIQCGEKVWTDQSKSAEEPKTMGDFIDVNLELCTVMLNKFELSEEARNPSAQKMIDLFRKDIAKGELNGGMIAWMNDVMAEEELKKK